MIFLSLLTQAFIQSLFIYSLLPRISTIVFLDSPLNEEGTEQARELRKFIEQEVHDTNELHELCQILNGTSKESSVVVSSNLRRAIATTSLALWPRIERTKEKILLLSSCQEISPNVDTKSLAPAHGIPDLNRVVGDLEKDGFKVDPAVSFDPTDNQGNKTTVFNGIKRLKQFSSWAFARNESTIIVGGHSLWFKQFFKTFCPYDADLPCKNKKIVNSGAISFIFHKAEENDDNGNPMYRVDPDSIMTVYGGYQ